MNKKGKLGYHPASTGKKGNDEETSEFREVVDNITQGVNRKDQKFVRSVLRSPRGRRFYKDMEGMAEGDKERFLRHNINDLARGKMNFSSYATAVAEGVQNAGGYVEVVDKMERDGYLEKGDKRRILYKIADKTREEHETFTRNLERLAHAAVWIFMAIGAVLILISGFSMTGAVVGTAFGASWLFLIGLVLFVMGLVLRVKK